MKNQTIYQYIVHEASYSKASSSLSSWFHSIIMILIINENKAMNLVNHFYLTNAI